jgi:hypothetical protein
MGRCSTMTRWIYWCRGDFGWNPNVSTTHNYLEHEKQYLNIGNYTEEGFAEMLKALPVRLETMKRAIARHVKIVFGTDAVAGAHGRNAEEFIYRVRDGGQKPMDALVSANLWAAESLGLSRRVLVCWRWGWRPIFLRLREIHCKILMQFGRCGLL